MMQRLYTVLLLCVINTWTLTSYRVNADVSAANVSTPLGNIIGSFDSVSNVRTFLGVPFAQPPLGNLRFQPPQPLTPFSAPVYANRSTYPVSAGNPLGSEDCLYLNIYAPPALNASQQLLPVLFFVPGGSFTSVAMMNGTNLAQMAQNMIVIETNYRVGPFGFLAHPALSAEQSPIQFSSNYGLLDQVAGLKWVQQNIASFGGDPKRVTLAGESAGSISVCLHLISPLSVGLYSSTIMESGGCDWSGNTLTSGEAIGVLFANALGCDSKANFSTIAACLRAANASAIQTAFHTSGTDTVFGPTAMGPITDGYFAPNLPQVLFPAGNFTKVPTLLGANQAEFGLFIAGLLGSTNQTWNVATQYAYFLSTNFSVAAAYYNPANQAWNGSPLNAIVDMWGGKYFICSTRRTGRYLSLAQNNTNVYMYNFNYSVNTSAYAPTYHGAVHGSELGFWWDLPNNLFSTQSPYSFYPQDQQVSSTMMQYWTNFIVSLNPNNNNNTCVNGVCDSFQPAASQVNWTAYVPANDNYMSIQYDASFTMQMGFHTPTCGVWDQEIPYPAFTIRYATNTSNTPTNVPTNTPTNTPTTNPPTPTSSTTTAPPTSSSGPTSSAGPTASTSPTASSGPTSSSAPTSSSSPTTTSAPTTAAPTKRVSSAYMLGLSYYMCVAVVALSSSVILLL